MTHSGGKPHAVGYKGQQYEVSFFNPATNKRQVLGWTDFDPDAKEMAEAIELHPSWTTPWITDLFAHEQHDGHPAESALLTPNAALTGAEGVRVEGTVRAHGATEKDYDD